MLKMLRADSNTSQEPTRPWTPRLTPTLQVGLLLVLIFAILALANIVQGAQQVLLLKAFFVAFLSVLPGWVYLQLPKSKVKELYSEYVLNLHRLRVDYITNLPEPPRTSIFWNEWRRQMHGIPRADANSNIYRLKFLAATNQDSFSPVLVTTLLLAVAWTIILQPLLNRNLLGSDLPIAQLSGISVDALAFGFLGSYTFVLQSTVRRFFQVDLKSRAYLNAISRIILVSALTIILSLLSSQLDIASTSLNAMAFFIGFFPESAFTYMAQVTTAVFRIGVPALEDKYPLTDLDGFDVYYRYRFLEEGIENMQNLATVNLADLILNTRIPAPRLVDWIDQSLLYIRVADRDRSRFETDRLILRRYGIRTATDLLDILGQTESPAPNLYQALLVVLNEEPGKAAPSTVESLRWALLNDANLLPVRNWKKYISQERSGRPILESPMPSVDDMSHSAIDTKDRSKDHPQSRAPAELADVRTETTPTRRGGAHDSRVRDEPVG